MLFFRRTIIDTLIDVDLDSRLLLNQKTTARLLGMKPQLLQQWDVQSVKRRGREVLYYWPDVLAERDRRRFPERPDGDEEFLDLDQQRARHSKEQADKLALENAAARDTLIYSTHMAELLGRVLTAVRNRLLALPNKVGGRLPENIRASIVDLLRMWINEALTELSEWDPGAAPDTVGNADRVNRSKRRSKNNGEARKNGAG